MTIPISFRESSIPIAKNEAQESEPLNLVPLSTIEADMTTQTILARPSHEQAGAIVVNLSTLDTYPPNEVHFEPKVKTIKASNAESTWIDFVAQDAEIPNVEPSDVHSRINTVAVFEDHINNRAKIIQGVENPQDQQPSKSFIASDNITDNHGISASAAFKDQVDLLLNM